MTDALTYLRNTWKDRQHELRPHIPDHAVTTKHIVCNSANSLTRCIILYLKLHGCWAERVSPEGRVIDDRQVVTDVLGRQREIGSVRRIYSTMTRGTADISAVIQGRAVKIEVKWGRDRLSKAQLDYAERVQAAGAVYIVIHDLDQFHQWYQTYTTTP